MKGTQSQAAAPRPVPRPFSCPALYGGARALRAVSQTPVVSSWTEQMAGSLWETEDGRKGAARVLPPSSLSPGWHPQGQLRLLRGPHSHQTGAL